MRVSIAHLFSWAAIAALAGTGLMQGAEHGSFHLDKQVRWGESVLPPGDYEISVPVASLGVTQMQVVGGNTNIFELPLSEQTQTVSDSSYLKLSNINGEYVVTTFQSGVTGRTYTFGVPKAMRRTIASKRHDDSITVGVN